MNCRNTLESVSIFLPSADRSCIFNLLSFWLHLVFNFMNIVSFPLFNQHEPLDFLDFCASEVAVIELVVLEFAAAIEVVVEILTAY